MQTSTPSLTRLVTPLVVILAGLLLTSCQSAHVASTPAASAPLPAAAPVASPPAQLPVPAAVPPAAPARAVIRIDAGSATPFTDSAGNVWLADQGFDNAAGVVDRGDIAIANTKDPAIYRTEHYSMSTFSMKVPNGPYTVRLHFAETYTAEVTAPGQRIFTLNVAGHEIKDFDVVAKAGGALRAYIESVDVVITDGELKITFTPTTQNPEINGIEIIPKG